MQSPRSVALALGLAAALAPSPPQAGSIRERYAPGEQALWAFELGGKRIGHCWSRYAGEVDLAGSSAHRFTSQVLLALDSPSGTLEQRFSGELWTDGAGHPLRFELQAAVSDAWSAVELSFAGEEAVAAILQGRQKTEMTRPVPAGARLLANNFLGHLELALVLDPPSADGAKTYPMFSGNTLQAFQLKVEHAEDLEGATDGAVAVFTDSLGERLRLDRVGKLVACEIPAQKLVLRRVDEDLEPVAIQRPSSPGAGADFASEEVVIADGQVSLAGTITKKKDAAGRLPAVFFVSGSGGQDRDGFSSGIDLGTHEILDRLTREGFLVLRVDDRGVGGSQGPTEALTYDDLVADARACLRFIASRPDVDPARIAAIGHSEGGETVPILAAEGSALAAIVLLAAPGRTMPAIVREQILYQRRIEGAGDEELERLGETVESFFEQLARGEEIDAEELPELLVLLSGARPWLESHLRQDPIATIQKVRCPVLILQGGRDIQVSAERDAPPLAAALDQAGHADHQLVVFPELDHLFKKTAGEQSSGLEYLKSRPIDSRFLDTLSTWLKTRLMPEGM